MKTYYEAKTTKEICKLLGIPESEAYKIQLRTKIVMAIKRHIEKYKITHAKVAEETGIGRTVITAIVNGNLQKISTDRLLDVAHGLGLQIRLKITNKAA